MTDKGADALCMLETVLHHIDNDNEKLLEGKICYSHILIYRTVNKIRFFNGHIQTSINVLFLFFFFFVFDMCVNYWALFQRMTWL